MTHLLNTVCPTSEASKTQSNGDAPCDKVRLHRSHPDAARVLQLLAELAEQPVMKLAMLEAGATARVLPLMDLSPGQLASRETPAPAGAPRGRDPCCYWCCDCVLQAVDRSLCSATAAVNSYRMRLSCAEASRVPTAAEVVDAEGGRGQRGSNREGEVGGSSASGLMCRSIDRLPTRFPGGKREDFPTKVR